MERTENGQTSTRWNCWRADSRIRKYKIWTTWTYKGTNRDVGTFFWYYGEPEKADCANDSCEELLRKWGEPLRTESFEEKTYLTELIALKAAEFY